MSTVETGRQSRGITFDGPATSDDMQRGGLFAGRQIGRFHPPASRGDASDEDDWTGRWRPSLGAWPDTLRHRAGQERRRFDCCLREQQRPGAAAPHRSWLDRYQPG